MGSRTHACCVVAVAFAILAPLASGGATGTLSLRAAIPWEGGDAACPDGFSSTIRCHPHPGGPTPVAGLGLVTQSYLYPVEAEPGPQCVGGFSVLGYTARLSVKGKGDIDLSLGPVDRCLSGPPSDTILTPTQPFTITGGSGVYAGASGSGVVSRENPRRTTAGHGAATDIWEGTVIVPGLQFDLTAPTISGASNKVVRAQRKAKRIRVTYKLTAVDDVDGPVAVTCEPKSGSWFKIGRRLVRCSTTDSSANTQTAKLTITVRKR